MYQGDFGKVFLNYRREFQQVWPKKDQVTNLAWNLARCSKILYDAKMLKRSTCWNTLLRYTIYITTNLYCSQKEKPINSAHYSTLRSLTDPSPLNLRTKRPLIIKRTTIWCRQLSKHDIQTERSRNIFCFNQPYWQVLWNLSSKPKKWKLFKLRNGT